MAIWPKLLALVTESELDNVSENVKTKIEEHLLHQDQLVEVLKAENCELTAVLESKQFDHEKELFDYQKQLKESTDACVQLRSQVADLEKKLNSVEEQWRELRRVHDTTALDLESAKRTADLVTEEKRQLFEQLEKRKAEVGKLNEDLKSLLSQAKSATEEKHAAIAREEEAKLSSSSLQHQVNRLEREKQLLDQQVKDMHVELTQKNRELQTLRKEKSTEVLQLQSELEHRIDEVHLLQGQLTSLKETSEEKDRRIDALASKIRALNEATHEMEEQYQQQINAQTKLVELYKNASEENQARVMELVSAFEEAQRLLKDATESRNEAEARMEAIESQYRSQVEKMTQEIDELKNELNRANDVVQGKAFTPESLETFFPTAASTSKVMRSGMTFAQMYSEYVKAQEEIQNLKNENSQLSEQLKQIVSEIEENTPVINKRMTEYHKAIETISCLRTQLASSVTDYEIVQSEKQDLKRRCGLMERENNRLKIQVSDSNRQIQVLLKEIEEAKGRIVQPGAVAAGEEEVSSSDEITADKVITKHLVTFRDIVELQSKNQKLLAVVRDLSEQQEQQEKKLTDEKTAELQKELKNALLQLEELQQNRVKQARMVESIIRQRDMYRILLTNYGVSDSLLGSPKEVSVSNQSIVFSPGDRGDSAANKSALNQLQSEFNTYKKEKAENEKMLNEKLEKLRSELSDSRIECAKTASQVEYGEERLKLLQTNMENYKKEATFLREKNQKHTTLITKHQQTISSLQHELMEAHEKLAKNEILLDNLRAERDLLKGIEQRLLHEKECLQREQQQKSQVLANLQAFQNNLERFESETKRNLEKQVEKYEKDTALLNMKVQNLQEEHQTAVKVWEKQEKDLQQKIEAEVNKNRKLHEDLVDAYSKLHAVNQELNAAKQNAGTAKASSDKNVPVKASTPSPSVAETKAIKEQLNEALSKVKALQEQLDLSRKTSERYLSMCNDLEFRVKELDEVNKHLKESMESALASNSETRKNLERQLEDMEKSNRNLIEDNMKVTTERETKMQELQSQVIELQKEVVSHKNISETAAKTAEHARNDCLSQKNIMEETQLKYERELMLHAEDVQALSLLKEVHQKCTSEIEQLKNAVRAAEDALHSKESSWADREKLILAEQDALKQRIKELETQNESLLHELELMGTRLASIKPEEWDNLRTESTSDDLRDTRHLLQIIQFVKKEKEILSSRFDATQAENVRFKVKIEQLQSELTDVKKELKEIHDNQEIKTASDAHHAELLRKVETMNLLTESNNLLRIEKENLMQAKQELEAKVQKLEQQIQPLSEVNKELNSQIEVLSAENEALRQEVKSWHSRTNQLLEQSHRIGPQEYRNLTRELDELKTQKQKLSEELQRKQNEASHLTSNLVTLKRELDDLKSKFQKANEEAEKRKQDNVDQQKTMVQVKKIGRKYKTQYDELKGLYEALLAKSKATENVAQDESPQELQKKLQDTEKALKDMKEEFEKEREKTKEEIESMQKDASTKEEKFKFLLAQLRQRYNNVNNQKDMITKEHNALSKEIEDLKKEKEEMKKQMSAEKQGSDEESARMAALKSQYDAKIIRLERDLKQAELQIEELRQKVARQQKQTVKSAAVGGIVERGSGNAEPLTANIKPLSSPVQPSGTSLRHTAHVASPSPRSTPTASIRPMAIGSVASSSTSQTRMAAVLPTTASTSAVVSSADDDVGAVIVSSGSSVPHATVQPTPATATVAPTTVAVTVTPSAHTPVISEVTTTPSVPSSYDTQVEQPSASGGESSQSILITGISHHPTHATALVGPRIEVIEATDAPVVETPAPTASVIVSPPATQTQMVPPTMKRQREGSPGSADSPDSSAAAQKRVRMISEGSQTNQQAAGASTSSSTNIAIVSAAATVVTRSKPEIPTSEVTPSVHIETTEPVPTVVSSSVPSPAFIVEEVTADPNLVLPTIPSTSDADTKVNPVEEREDQSIEWEAQEESKHSSEFAVEVMEEEEEEPGEQMEDFEEERGPEDEDMVDDQVVEEEEMCDPHTDDTIVIDVLDGNSEQQMEADSSLQAPPDEQCMAPPAFPLTQVSEATSVAEEIIGQSSSSQSRRPPITQRVPARQDRLPSVQRQLLQPFTIPGQGQGFEEGDDSIVPSTPTLFVPRRSDGFAEAVSSPHVPPGRFLFSSTESSPTQQGLSQLASQGALGVDDTRMDLSQFDDGSGRTVPSTSLQVSPPAEASVPEVPEVTTESVINEQNSDAAVPVPSIKIESPEGEELKETIQQPQTSTSQETQNMAGGDGPAADEPKVSDKVAEAESSSTGLVPSSVGSGESEVPKKESDVGDGDSQSAGPSQNVRKPIVWGEGDAGSSSTSAPSSTSTTSTPGTTQPFPLPGSSTETTGRQPRARRMRYRGSAAATATTSNYQRGSGWSGTGRRARGTGRRSRMF